MLIILQFSSKRRMIIENDEKNKEKAIKIATQWKFYPKQVEVFRQALSKSVFHDNFVQNVEKFLSPLLNEHTCDFKIILCARYQIVPDFIDMAWYEHQTLDHC